MASKRPKAPRPKPGRKRTKSPDSRGSPLEAIRERIDAIDADLHQLINERAQLAQQVGISKHASGHTVDFYRPEREAEILTRVKRDNTGPLPDSDMAHLFREIISCCLALEQPLKGAVGRRRDRGLGRGAFAVDANRSRRAKDVGVVGRSVPDVV